MPGRGGIGDQRLWRALSSSEEKLATCLLSNFYLHIKILCTETRIFNITFQAYEPCEAENQGREAPTCELGDLSYAGRSKQLS